MCTQTYLGNCTYECKYDYAHFIGIKANKRCGEGEIIQWQLPQNCTGFPFVLSQKNIRHDIWYIMYLHMYLHTYVRAV